MCYTTFSYFIAVPFSDASITRSYSVRLGSTITLTCTIPTGPLRSRYSFRWSKGLVEVTPGENGFQDVSLNGNQLEFSRVKVSDASRGYFCEVDVTANNTVYHRQGATISLSITGEHYSTLALSVSFKGLPQRTQLSIL